MDMIGRIRRLQPAIKSWPAPVAQYWVGTVAQIWIGADILG